MLGGNNPVSLNHTISQCGVPSEEQNYLHIESLTFVWDPKGNTMYVEGLKALLKPGKDIQFPSNLYMKCQVHGDR